ncbi:sterol desaturase family protein [Emcibacter nanhaiensis]|uniref:Sterol desaturase family protein n=1 Tax=Emcibacter nanhaiensis TaxID=1505037 RepID=A0A501PKR2_9PROT|nr:sterol desaturase family protein [Emcibacter nanhaiensis]TPD60647.1 sterol desaturase family protein [Emcibacter nanhaiensis]
MSSTIETEARVTDYPQSSGIRYLLSWILWPGLLASCMFAVITGLNRGLDPVLTLFSVYFVLIVCIAILERVMPHEPSWNKNDGQIGNDIFHTIVNYIVVGAVVEAAVVALIAKLVMLSTTLTSASIWPVDWPVWAQFILLLFVGEAGSYTAHRISHEVPFLWRFHAVHHSATSLYWLNTGRFHTIDVIETVVLALPLPLLLGAPAELMFLFTCFTMFVGVLSHCNIEMRFGILDWIFNTPGVHRWHHSTVIEEGNTNYGENLMVYDVLLGTHFRPGRQIHVVGTDTPVPKSILGQMIKPLTGYKE